METSYSKNFTEAFIAASQSNRIYLRPVQITDLGNWCLWFNDLETTRFLNIATPYNRLDAENYWQKTQHDPNQILFSIVDYETNQHIGSITLKNIDWRSKNAELAIVIGHPDFRNKGYGKDALITLCHLAFNRLNLNRVYLYVRTDHPAGIRSYLKAGFVQEGIARQQLYRSGKYYDLALMGILAEEFQANKVG